MLRPLFLFYLLFSCLSIFSQSIDRIQGDLIVQLQAGTEPVDLQQEILSLRTPFVIRVERKLSKRMNLYLFRFDPAEISEKDALQLVRQQASVQLAQYNHFVESRHLPATTTPNDTNFGQQWALDNTGQSGGLPDADIDATDAWDITTGGVSALGDTIVVAVIDEGVDVDHEDLYLWKNHAEIPGDGIDNDNNGYIDDFDGWNAYNSSGSLPPSVHGTHVSGIVAARGDNSIGVSGVSWDTQVMFVAGSSGNEATVLEAYGYVLEQRARYNNSNGTEGAFVVATNSSFGVNFGQPSDFPVWCAMYDSLGAMGIMNAVATMNVGQDVDQVGDMPTTCLSDFIIGITNTTDLDQKNAGSAFGTTHIDLGAPGTNVLSTFPDNVYGFNTGTSMATPHVAGTLALMVAGACPALMIQYRNDPAGTALLFRDWILNGVDSIQALQNLVATGGRLNAFNSLNLLLDSCANLPVGCLPPFQLAGSSNTDTTAFLSWNQWVPAQNFVIRYREQGQSSWTDSTTSTTTNLALSGLTGCQTYEFQVQAVCSLESSGYFATGTFITEGCCEAPQGIQLASLTDTTANFQWQSVFGSTAYRLEFRPVGDTIWSFLLFPDTVGQLVGLSSCTSYEMRLTTLCGAVQVDYSPIRIFTTRGCGACLDQTYCDASGSVDFEWIRAVKIGPADVFSDADGGYGDFTDVSYQFSIDSTYSVELVPGFSGPPFDEDWRIWVDLNQDGLFDSTELLFDPAPELGTVTGMLSFPFGTLTGGTRMRVAMKFPGFGTPEPPNPCGTFEGGEVEDFCITLTAGDSVFCALPANLAVSSVPGSDSLELSWDGVSGGLLYDIRLERGNSGLVEQFSTDQTSFRVGGLVACSSYTFEVQARCTPFGSGFSAPFSFTSKGCGACLDLDYCVAIGQNANNEWIAGVEVGNFAFSSGPDQGYGNYTNFSILFHRGDSLPLQLRPGFTTSKKAENWVVWVDWNQNGGFDAPDELVFQADSSLADTVVGSLIVPMDALTGPTRMRIVMNRDSMDQACISPALGEVEDYCVNVAWPVAVETPVLPEVQVFPNPTFGQLEVRSSAEIESIEVFSTLGKIVYQSNPKQRDQVVISLDQVPTGIYVIRVFTSKGIWQGKIVRE